MVFLIAFAAPLLALWLWYPLFRAQRRAFWWLLGISTLLIISPALLILAPLQLICGGLFAAMGMGLVWALVRDVLALILRLARGHGGARPVLAPRNTCVVLGISLLLCGYGLIQGTRVPEVREHRIALPNLPEALEGLRIGVPAEFFGEGLSADVRTAVDAALKEYEKLGAQLVPISLPRTELSVPVYYILAPAEASSNLSRFDGVKFGHRAKNFADLNDMYKKTRAEGFGDEVKRRIMIGAYVLSEGYYDAYYLQAQKIRRMIADDFQAAFKECDVIAGPAAPTTAWAIGGKADPVSNYLADVFTLPASLAGLPGLSLPAGFGEGGMPVGLQLIGNYFAEGKLLNAAHRFQQATDFHLQRPAGI